MEGRGHADAQRSKDAQAHFPSCRGTLAVVSLFSNSYNNLTRLLEAYWRPKYPAGSRAGTRTKKKEHNGDGMAASPAPGLGLCQVLQACAP